MRSIPTSFLLALTLALRAPAPGRPYQPAPPRRPPPPPPPGSGPTSSRRDAVASAVALVLVVAAGSSSVPPLVPPANAAAVTACRPRSLNCIRTSWSPPAGTERSDAVRDVRDALSSYPRKGQSGVDCNGWRVVQDDLDGPTSSARLEYYSCVGPAAVSINLARPFVDDLTIEVGGDGSAEVKVRSSSRMGSSDLGVNKKRVDYLGAELRGRGWTVPTTKYGSQ